MKSIGLYLILLIFITSCASYHKKKIEQRADEAYSEEQIINFAENNNLVFDQLRILKDKKSLERLFTNFALLGGEINFVLFFDKNKKLIDFGNASKCTFVNIQQSKKLSSTNSFKNINLSLFYDYTKKIYGDKNKENTDYTVVFLWSQIFPKPYLKRTAKELVSSVQSVIDNGAKINVVSLNWDRQPGFPDLNLKTQ